ncbi:hypothetical protein Gotur_005765 [Gossypium turneri]
MILHCSAADVLQAMHLASISSVPFTLKVAVYLGLLETIAKAADTPFGFLATHSIVTCNQITDQDALTQRSYGLASVGKYFLQNEDGVPFAALLRLHLEKYVIECW